LRLYFFFALVRIILSDSFVLGVLGRIFGDFGSFGNLFN
jgi:hypothetical protein